jgi:DNA-directed RNA polymerase specialized sigma24 family protein
VHGEERREHPCVEPSPELEPDAVGPGRVIPLAALEAVARTREALASLERTSVIAARELGCSWPVIAAALGVTRQAANRRFHSIDPRPRRKDPMFAELEAIARAFQGGRQPELPGPGPGNER